jgi:hypothetical protein
MSITIPDLPLPLEQALLARASAEKKTLAEAIVDAAARDLGVELPKDAPSGAIPESPKKKRDLSFLMEGPPLEPEVLEALAAQRQIDHELWQ